MCLIHCCLRLRPRTLRLTLDPMRVGIAETCRVFSVAHTYAPTRHIFIEHFCVIQSSLTFVYRIPPKIPLFLFFSFPIFSLLWRYSTPLTGNDHHVPRPRYWNITYTYSQCLSSVNGREQPLPSFIFDLTSLRKIPMLRSLRMQSVPLHKTTPIIFIREAITPRYSHEGKFYLTLGSPDLLTIPFLSCLAKIPAGVSFASSVTSLLSLLLGKVLSWPCLR